MNFVYLILKWIIFFFIIGDGFDSVPKEPTA